MATKRKTRRMKSVVDSAVRLIDVLPIDFSMRFSLCTLSLYKAFAG